MMRKDDEDADVDYDNTWSDTSFADSIRKYDMKYGHEALVRKNMFGGQRMTYEQQAAFAEIKSDNKSMKKTIKHLLQELAQDRATIKLLSTCTSLAKQSMSTSKLEFMWNIPDFEFCRLQPYDSTIFCFDNIAWRLSFGQCVGGSHYGLILSVVQDPNTITLATPQVVMCQLRLHHEFRFPYEREPIVITLEDKMPTFCGYQKFVPCEVLNEYIMDDGGVLCSIILRSIDKNSAEANIV